MSVVVGAPPLAVKKNKTKRGWDRNPLSDATRRTGVFFSSPQTTSIKETAPSSASHWGSPTPSTLRHAVVRPLCFISFFFSPTFITFISVPGFHLWPDARCAPRLAGWLADWLAACLSVRGGDTAPCIPTRQRHGESTSYYNLPGSRSQRNIFICSSARGLFSSNESNFGPGHRTYSKLYTYEHPICYRSSSS